MTTGWPQNQQDLRWPYSDADDSGPGSQAGGRVATDSERSDRSAASPGFGGEHPSGPLPVTRAPQPRGRFGRGKSRDSQDDGAGDSDYDWIRYLGEAGPAQEHSRRPPEFPAAGTTEHGRAGRGRLSRRPAQPEPPSAAPQVSPFPAGRPVQSASPAEPWGPAPRPSAIQFPQPEWAQRVAGGPRSDPNRRPGNPADPAEPPASRPRRHRPGQPNLAAQAAAGQAAARSGPYPELELDLPDATDKAARPGKRDRAGRRGTGRKDRADRDRADRDRADQRSAVRELEPISKPEPVRTAEPISKPEPVRATVPDQRAGVQTVESRQQVQTVPAESPAAAPVTIRPAKKHAAKDARKAGRKSARRKVRHPVLLAVGGGVVAIAAAGAVLATQSVSSSSAGPVHTISTPKKLLAYQQEPALASGMGAQALRAEIARKGNGEASHVVDAVYEDSTSTAAKSGPLIILFIGGNLSGSAGSFISSFTGLLPGAFVTGAGSLGGQAACVPGAGGHPAECAWADNDTFGLIASPTLGATALGRELRSIRPLVEHTAR